MAQRVLDVIVRGSHAQRLQELQGVLAQITFGRIDVHFTSVYAVEVSEPLRDLLDRLLDKNPLTRISLQEVTWIFMLSGLT
jgi:hypothetical protein